MEDQPRACGAVSANPRADETYPMQLSDLVETVQAVRAVSKRTDKISLLAACLNRTQGRETELAALYLSGLLPQGRIGVGWRLIQDAMVEEDRPEDSLLLTELDTRLDALATEQGPGSTERRIRALRQLFQQISRAERTFLSALLVGEVRQGALEGLVVEAIAKAARLPAQEVRQAFMFSEHIGSLARRALEEGAAGLARYALAIAMSIDS